MSNKEYEEMINKYFDEELNKSQEILLFTMLSENYEAIEYFKKLNFLKSNINETKEDISCELEERIFRSIENETKSKSYFPLQKFLMIGSYALSVILIILSIFLFNEVNDSKKEINNAVKVIMDKSETIELLLNNTLPAAQVKAYYQNEVIIKSNL